MENKQIFDNLIDLKIIECHSQNTLEDGTMEKYPGESQEEFKNRHYSEILQIVNNRHFCFIQLYNLARDKKAPKEFILTILKEAVKCLNFGIKFVEHEFAEPYQFIDKMKFFEEESQKLSKIGLQIAEMCYGNDSVMAALWRNYEVL